jgi:phosphate transport system substrate-binding protein
MNDSCRLIIVTRKLGADEEEIFKKQKYFPVQTNIARDAIAVIVNNNNNDTLFTFKQLTQILKGEINEWKGISTKSSLSKIQIVFDNAGRSTLRYMKDSIIGSHQLSENIFAAKSNEEVIKYVQNNPNAIGFIGSNWCKDLSDSTNLSFTKKIKVVGINPVVKTEIDFPQPYQSYVFSGFYPLSRKIYSVSREARAGLGTGFVSFLSSDKGQRIILKGGLVPATMPIRIVKIKNTL